MKRDQTDLTYEGRPLAKPDEELVDQGLGFDIGTLLSRRRMMRILGIGAATAGLAACGTDSGSSSTTTASSTSTSSSSSSSSEEVPEETAGPYPGDGSNGPNVLTESGIVRRDIRPSFGSASGVAEGVPLTVNLTVLDAAGGSTPLAGGAVYAWHCTRDGE